jgi:hypothetical protein
MACGDVIIFVFASALDGTYGNELACQQRLL